MSGAPLLRCSGRDAHGRAYLVRPSVADDAPALVRLRDEVAAEGGLVAATPGERSPLEEQLALASLLRGGGLALSLEVEGELAGQLAVARLRGPYQAHVGELSVALSAPHRGAGLGGVLLGVAVDWAGAVRLRRLQLGVFAGNAPALAAYRRGGFVEEGVQRAAVRVGDRERDLVLMARLL